MISTYEKVKVIVLTYEKVKLIILTYEKVKVSISPLCVVDIEVFTDEEAKRAKGAKDEQQEGREELSFFVNLYKYKYQEGKEELRKKTHLPIWTNTVVNLYNGKYEYDIRKMGMMRMMLVIMVLLMMMITL